VESPLNLAESWRYRRVRRWQAGYSAAWNCEYVTVAVSEDGRWFVYQSRADTAGFCADEHQALRRAEELMAAQGDWAEVPANFDAHDRPVEPGWRVVDGRWTRR
jgi:hypothetical protein